MNSVKHATPIGVLEKLKSVVDLSMELLEGNNRPAAEEVEPNSNVDKAALVLVDFNEWLISNCPQSDFADEIGCEINYAIGYIHNEMWTTAATESVTTFWKQYYDPHDGRDAYQFLALANEKIRVGFYLEFCHSKTSINK